MQGTYKYILLLFFIFFIAQSSLAQNHITGVVTDKNTQEKLMGAVIYIRDLKAGTATDTSGRFEIENAKSAHYIIEVKYVGYLSLMRDFHITSDTFLRIELEPSHREISEVVITGVSRSTEIKQCPMIIKSIDHHSLNQNAATNIVDALKNIPGVSQITTGAAVSKPVIRGLGYQRVISLLNGLKLEGQQWGDEHGVEIDEYMIDKIEIIKGPGSLMYGSDGIAGVLNFLTAHPPHRNEVKTQFLSQYQTNNKMQGYSIQNSGNKEGWQWQARWTSKYASNFENEYDGKVLNSGFREWDANAYLGLTRNWGHTQLHVNSYNSRINLPEGERDSLGRFTYINTLGNTVTASTEDYKGYGTGFPHQRINHLFISSNNYFILPKGTVNADIGWQKNVRREYADIQNPKEAELYFDLQTINYAARYNFKIKKEWETSVGMSGMLQNHTNKGAEYIIPDYHLADIGVFLYTQKKILSKWNLAGGVRYDVRNMISDALILDSMGTATTVADSTTFDKFSAFKRTFTGVSGSVGVSYQIDDRSTLKFNLSQGFRAPGIAELASNGKHEGTYRYELGNTNLQSETSRQVDLAYYHNTHHIEFELSPFINHISNFIYSHKLLDSLGQDVIIDPQDPAPAFQFKQDQAVLAGFEIYLDVHPHPLDWLHIANSFSYVQGMMAVQSDSTRYLPSIPAPKYRAELRAELIKSKKNVSNITFNLAMDSYFKQDKIYRAFDTETATPAYTLWSAGIYASFHAFGKKNALDVFLNFENITNRSYQNHLSKLKYAPENMARQRIGIYNMGRNMSLKLILNI